MYFQKLYKPDGKWHLYITKGKNVNLQLYTQGKYYFTNEGKIKDFSGKKKIKLSIISVIRALYRQEEGDNRWDLDLFRVSSAR